MTDKSVLRREVKKRLALIVSEKSNRLQKSGKVVDNLVMLLKNLEEQKSIHSIGLYAPLKDEVDILQGLDNGLKSISQSGEWHYSFPFGEGEAMSFRRCLPEELIETEQFGVKIYTPKEGAKEETPDVLVIPGLAFSNNGHRLGRGKGYYDRYLEKYKGIKVAVCFKEQVFEDIPYEKHDQLVDFLVHDEEIVDCNND